MKRFAVYVFALLLGAGAWWLLLPGRSRPSASDPSAPPAQAGPVPPTARPTAVAPASPSLREPAAIQPSEESRGQAAPKRSAGGTGPMLNSQAPAPAGNAPRKRSWDPQFLAGLRDVAAGDPIRFELVDGQWAHGTARYLRHTNGEVVYVTGSLTAPEPGRFFFQKQTRPGMAGTFVGVVELPGSEKAFRLEPSGPGGSPELVEQPLKDVVCLRMPAGTNLTEEIPPLRPDAFPTVPIPSYQTGIVVLESLPGSTPVLYLDYQGGYTPTWGGISYERPSVNNSAIRDVWKRVAEDYMPFNVNVTTDLEVFQNAPEGSRQRVIITPTSDAAPGAGGVAYIGSFNWTGTPDTPCWVFMVSGKSCAEAVAHEAGHTLGLGHDGKDVGSTHTEYYGGQGGGTTGWAPIMGVGYYQNVSQWSQGEYADANNTENDLFKIVSQNNNVDYRADDTGSTLATARYLEVYSNAPAFVEGVVERTADTDAFQFTTAGGAVSLRADPVGDWGNVAIQATLCDVTDAVIASNNPSGTLWAAISTNLSAGTYTFKVTGAGRNNPLNDGFSAYASVGYYTVTGAVAAPRLPTRFTISERSTNDTLVGVVPANNTNGNPLAYAIISGNISNAFAINSSGTLSVASSGALNYEPLALKTQLPVQFELFVNITNTVDGAQTELNRRVVVAVTNVNEAPSLTGFSVSLLEHTQPGLIIGQVAGSDPDFYTLLSYSIVAGNSNAMFRIDTNSGAISVAGDLNTVTQTLYTLSVVVSDRTAPAPLSATSAVAVIVLTNASVYRSGTIGYAAYDNITGSTIATLTNASAYPLDPALEKQVTLFEGDTDRADSYGAVMRGYLIPPATGSYTFWVAGDDSAELWLSTSTNVAAAVRVASVSSWTGSREWTKYSSQQSTQISLVAGQAYYVEARLKENTGGDNLAVAWQCATAGITRDVIPGRFLAPFFMNYVPHPAGFSYKLHKDAATGSRLGTVSVTDVNTNDDHSFRITSGNSGAIFSIDAATGTLRVSNSAALLATAQTSYSLQVRAIDNGAPPRSNNATVTVSILATNAMAALSPRQEIWNSLGSGTAVSDLTGHARFPKRPDALRSLTAIDSGSTAYGDNYGSRIRAYLTPTNTGSFTFFIASDDASALKLSTNTDPAKAVQIASVAGYTDYKVWTDTSSQKSSAISLVAGQSYYLEALHKEGGGGDHVEVAWIGPGLAGTNVIDGAFLTAVDLNYPPDLTNRTVQITAATSNGAVVTTLSATDSALDTLNYALVSGNTGSTFALDPDSGALTVADKTLLASYSVPSFSLVVRVQDSGYGGLYPLESTQATVTVQILDNRPAYVWTGAGTNDNWTQSSNWTAGVPPANSRLIFAGTARQTNNNDLLARVGLVTFSNGGFNIVGNPLGLLAGISSTGTNTWAITSTLENPQSFSNLSGSLSISAPLNLGTNSLALVVSSAMRLGGPVSGSGNLVKTGAGTLTLAGTNPFTGGTFLSGGTLALAGSLGSGLTATGGVLTGSGTLSGKLTLASNATLRVNLNGLAPVTGFDQITLAGTNNTLALTGRLDIVATPNLPEGVSFLILSNQGPASVSGSFSNLPQFAAFSLAGYRWRINYAAGTGNDVALTVLPAPSFAPIDLLVVDELATLVFTNAVTNAPIPGHAWTYSLLAAPTGAALNTNTGVLTWTPSESQGPSTNLLRVRVTDNGSPALSATNAFTVIVNELNLAPLIILTSPADGSSLPAPVPLAATVSDPDGTLDRVEFYMDGFKLGQATAAPFTLSWTNPSTAVHALWAVAVDSYGASATSAVARITVLPSAQVTLLSTGSVWKYLDNGSDQGGAWVSNHFNDASWAAGPAELGYGDGGEATVVNGGPSTNHFVTTYFRRAIHIPDASLVTALNARLLRDDGAVVYLNGVEVWRDGLPVGTNITFLTLANQTISGAAETGSVSKVLNPASLVSGTNVVAVEIHQVNATSTDVSFDLELKAVVAVPSPPQLSLGSRSGALSFAWPLGADFFGLYWTTNLSPPVSWTLATNSPVLDNGLWSVTLPVTTNSQRFYHLQTR